MMRLIFGLVAMLLVSTANAQLSMSTFSVQFINQKINGFGVSQSVWVQNLGQTTVTPSLTNSCYGDFEVSSTCDSQLSPNMSCTITIQFEPHQAGYQSCNISLSDNAGDYESLSVSGQGVP